MKWNTRNTPSVQKWAHVSRLQTDNHGTVVRDANGKDTGNRRPVGGRLAAPIVEVEVDKWGRVITRSVEDRVNERIRALSVALARLSRKG